MNDESSSSESDSDLKQEMVLLELFLYRVSCFKANVCGSLSAIFVWSHDLSTPTTPPRTEVYSEQLLHSCSLILDWNSACPE